MNNNLFLRSSIISLFSGHFFRYYPPHLPALPPGLETEEESYIKDFSPFLPDKGGFKRGFGYGLVNGDSWNWTTK